MYLSMNKEQFPGMIHWQRIAYILSVKSAANK